MRSMRAPRSATPEPLDPESVSPSGPRRAMKQAGLVALCAIWVVLGLVGHDPWKTEDATTFGIAWEMVRGGQVVVPMLAGELAPARPPLVPALAAAAIAAFSPPLAPHNAARLAAGVLLAVILAAAALASRELNGRAFRWLPVLILVGSIGFWERAHALSPELGLTAGLAIALWGFALALRRPLAGGAVIGLGTGIAFLSHGFAGPLWVALTAVILPAASATWRTRAHAFTIAAALVVALPLGLAWTITLEMRDPIAYAAWLAASDLRSQIAPLGSRGFDPLYTLRNLPWFAWPAAPLVLWTLWIRGRGFNGGLADAGIVLPATLALVMLGGLSLQNEPRLTHAIPILVPLALLASLEVDSLKRGYSGALDWFGILTFGLLALRRLGPVDRVGGRRHVARDRAHARRQRAGLPVRPASLGARRGDPDDAAVDRAGAARAALEPARDPQLGGRRRAAVGPAVDHLAALRRPAPQLPRRGRVAALAAARGRAASRAATSANRSARCSTTSPAS